MSNRHLFYTESSAPDTEGPLAHIISADSESVAKAEELIRATLLDECLQEGSTIVHVRYLGPCEHDTLVVIGELAS